MFRVRRLFALSAREWLDLVRAQLALVHAWLRLRTRSRGSVVHLANPAPSSTPTQRDIARAAELTVAIARAARHGAVSTTCLMRATALERLLRGSGINGGRVCVGVRMRDGTFSAHAWVELGDFVLGDRREHVRTYTPVSEIQVALV